MSKASRNRDIARAKVAEMRAQEARRARQRRLFTVIGAVVIAIGAAVGIVLAVTGGGSSGNGTKPSAGSTPTLKLGPLSSLGTLQPAPNPGAAGFEGVPIPAAAPLAGTDAAATGAKVDGIRCQSSEQLLFHIHAHLTIFVNGSPRQVPADIGIPSQGAHCLYWLHTHAADGIIHVESPVRRVYTLGDFFDEWGQPLGLSALGPISGHVVAIYNGKVYQGNPRNIPLNAHAQIQLEVGKPLIAPENITFSNDL